MEYINYNGNIYSSNEPIVTAQNRGLRYGDGLFETIKLKNGLLILADAHFDRLWNGMKTLKFEIPKLFTKQKLQSEILQLASKNKLTNARVRLTIIRGEGGIYDAHNHTPNYLIEALPLPLSNGEFNTNGLQLCIYNDAVKSIDVFSNVKTNNYLPYFMGALHAKDNRCNDALILNSQGNICDTTIANVFYIKDNVIYTPALAQGCVAGTMRNWLITKLPELGYNVQQTVVTTEQLLNADEVFLTNAIYNIRWVAAINDVIFSNNIVYKIVNALQKNEVAIFI
jgi:branched-chain amino acid aminotransferase